MSKDEKDAAEAPKKSSRMALMIIVVAVVALLGGGAGAFFMMKSDSAEAAGPEKGAVVAIENPLTINLTDGHYLKVGFALQMTTDATEEIETSQALNIAIETYTGLSVAELSTEKGRQAAKEELLSRIVKAYTEDDKQLIMDIYFTQFVTQ